MTTIGVIIPAYNAGAWIDEALASVAAQKRAPDQVVVVDDASTDDTAEVANRWVDRLPLTVMTGRANTGPGGARRDGIAALTTDLVALLDADDVWLDHHLDVLQRAYERTGVEGLVSASALRWVPGQATATRGRPGPAEVPPPADQLRRLVERDFLFSGTLFSRSLHDRVGGFRDFRGTEDWDLWLRMVAAGARVVVPTLPTVLHRVHPASLSCGPNLVAEEIRVLETFLDEQNVTIDIQAAARRTLRRLRANLRLQRSYVEARAGHRWQARMQAIGALTGVGPTPLYAAAMVGAPAAAVEHRDRLQTDAQWQVER